MSTAVVVNALVNGEGWKNSIAGMDPVKELHRKLLQLAPKEDIYAIVEQENRSRAAELSGMFKPLMVKGFRATDVFRAVYGAIKSYKDAVYLFIDAPLIDLASTKRMISLHNEERAEYTYGDGFPYGMTPEILKVDLFPKLASLLEKDGAPIERSSVFSGLSKEINSFDIETHFASRDLKLRRLELHTSLKRNSILVQRVIEEKGIGCGFEEFCALIEAKPFILRTVPSYVEVEICADSTAPCKYSPLPMLRREKGFMDLTHFKTVIDRLRAFSGAVHVSLSYLGEPLLHENIKEIIEYAVSNRETNLLLETDGVRFLPAFSGYIAGLGAENLHLIFSVDAVNDETYRNIRGGELKKVEKNVRYLLSKNAKNVYVQMVRTTLNEQEMFQFYDVWEKEGAKVIIQKYNPFLGLLPDLAQYDLKPLERMCCWHLLRDLVIFWNGDVPRCKQDIEGRFHLGNILTEDVETVWERGAPFYLDHCAKKYDEHCAVCDEFYTFNF